VNLLINQLSSNAKNLLSSQTRAQREEPPPPHLQSSSSAAKAARRGAAVDLDACSGRGAANGTTKRAAGGILQATVEHRMPESL
jgi:hypothetical protein